MKVGVREGEKEEEKKEEGMKEDRKEGRKEGREGGRRERREGGRRSLRPASSLRYQLLRLREQKEEARRKHLKFSSFPSPVPSSTLCGVLYKLFQLLISHSLMRKVLKLHLIDEKKRGSAKLRALPEIS